MNLVGLGQVDGLVNCFSIG